MMYEKWAEPLHERDKGACDECESDAVAAVFAPCMKESNVGQRRTGRLCKHCLSCHPEIYDTLYEDMCISGMTIEHIKADFARTRG